MFRIWVPDLDSPSYFVAIAAVELGFFKQEGIDIEFVHNTKEGPELVREGKLDFIAGPAYAGTRSFPAWERDKAAVRPVAVFLLVPGCARHARR
jgi:NitT/TauT family transport system substrate-binding protein